MRPKSRRRAVRGAFAGGRIDPRPAAPGRAGRRVGHAGALALPLLLLAAPAFAAGEPTAAARASKPEVSAGEIFVVEVKVTAPPGTAFEFPPEAVHESFELRTAPTEAAAPPRGTPSPPAGTRRYQAAVFALGEVEVPPIPIRYRLPDGTTGEVRTAPIPLRVVSLLPKAPDEQRLADIRGPVSVPIGRAFWIGLTALAVAVAALAWWMVRRRRPGPAIAAPLPALEPDQEARRALEALVASGRLARGEYRLFYIELTSIAKRYLEGRLAAPIVEMTTAEMLAHLKAARHGSDLVPALRELTSAADQIKFAKGSGLTGEAERHLASTRTMIDSLETRMRPAATEDGKAPAAGGEARLGPAAPEPGRAA